MATGLRTPLDKPKSEGMDITTNAALHGLFTNQPGTNTVRDGIRSWQNSPPGSMRPFVRGWPSARGASRRWHSMHGSSVRSRESTWPLQRAMSSGSMSGGTRPVVVGGFSGARHIACETFGTEPHKQHATKAVHGCHQRPVLADVLHGSGGLLGSRHHLFKRDGPAGEVAQCLHVAQRHAVGFPLRHCGWRHIEMRRYFSAPAFFGVQPFREVHGRKFSLF